MVFRHQRCIGVPLGVQRVVRCFTHLLCAGGGGVQIEEMVSVSEFAVSGTRCRCQDEMLSTWP
jgi:hypothetical protein